MCTIAGAIPITYMVKLIGKHNFVKAALDENFETFVINMKVLIASKIMNHFSEIA